MKVFGKRKQIKDERITMSQNKIFKEAYFVAIAISILSILFKTLYQNGDIMNALPETAVVIISILYFTVRNITLGLYSDEVEIHDKTNKLPMIVKILIFGISMGIVVAVFFGVRSAILFADESNKLWYFGLSFFASLMIYIPFFAFFLLIWHLTAKKASEKASRKHQDE